MGDVAVVSLGVGPCLRLRLGFGLRLRQGAGAGKGEEEEEEEAGGALERTRRQQFPSSTNIHSICYSHLFLRHFEKYVSRSGGCCFPPWRG